MVFTDKEIRDKSIGQLYSETKLPTKVIGDIQKIGEKAFEAVIDAKYQLLEQKKDAQDASLELQEAYNNIIDLLKEYCDLKEEYYNIIALWIIGTYLHKNFPSYPYLYFNAMKGSGKSRTMKLVTTLAQGGQMLNSMTEAVLFRTDGTLGIDEYEGMERKGGEALRELLNSGYKKGTLVKRMKKKRTMEGEEMVVEDFEVYRPIVMANISGIESVLEDRCIPLILEKSNKSEITNLVEIFDIDPRCIKTKEILSKLCNPKENSVVSVDVVSLENLYKSWNSFIRNDTKYTNYTNDTNNTNDTTPISLFKTLKFAGIGGRDLELSLPIIILSNLFGQDMLNKTTLTLKNIMEDKKDDSFAENFDIMVIDFVSQLPENTNFRSVNSLVQEFKQFIQMTDEWINAKWIGKAFKRLSLVIEKRRKSSGREVRLDIKKAQQKIQMFKSKDDKGS